MQSCLDHCVGVTLHRISVQTRHIWQSIVVSEWQCKRVSRPQNDNRVRNEGKCLIGRESAYSSWSLLLRKLRHGE